VLRKRGMQGISASVSHGTLCSRIAYVLGTLLFGGGIAALAVAGLADTSTDKRVLMALVATSLLPTSGLLYLTGAYLWVHRDG